MSFCLAENHLSPSVPLLFCLKKSPCLYLSLCYSVSHLFCLYHVEKSWQRCALGSGIKKGDMYKKWVCNYHVFSWLYTAKKKTPNKHQEGRLQHARRACSWSKKSVFLNADGHVQGGSRAKKVYKKVSRIIIVKFSDAYSEVFWRL